MRAAKCPVGDKGHELGVEKGPSIKPLTQALPVRWDPIQRHLDLRWPEFGIGSSKRRGLVLQCEGRYENAVAMQDFQCRLIKWDGTLVGGTGELVSGEKRLLRRKARLLERVDERWSHSVNRTV